MTNAEKRCCLIMGDNSHSVKQFSGTGSWNRLQSEQPTVRVACSVLPMSRAPERPRRLSLFQNTTSWVPLPAKQSHSPHVVPLLGLTLSLSARWRNPAMAAFGFALAGIAGALRVGARFPRYTGPGSQLPLLPCGLVPRDNSHISGECNGSLALPSSRNSVTGARKR
jgi:hypothetical protein